MWEAITIITACIHLVTTCSTVFPLKFYLFFNILIDSSYAWRLSGREPACQCRTFGFHPWVEKIPWRRRWQPGPVLLPGKSHGQRSPVGCSLWHCKELWLRDQTTVCKLLCKVLPSTQESPRHDQLTWGACSPLEEVKQITLTRVLKNRKHFYREFKR